MFLMSGINDDRLRILLDTEFTQGIVVKPVTFEPSRGKTNNVVSEQVPHKPSCTSTEAS